MAVEDHRESRLNAKNPVLLFYGNASERWVRHVWERLQGARVGGQWCGGAPSGGLGALAGCRPRIIVDVGDC
eukprot:401663-Prymnesium_polylepis.1